MAIPNLFAQAFTQRADSAKTKTFCLGSQPPPLCKIFAITEFGFSYRLLSDERSPNTTRGLWTAEIGAMVNSKTKSAWGATLFGSIDYDEIRWGLRPRYRRWFNHGTALDIAPGIILNGNERALRPAWPNLSTQVCLHSADFAGLTAQIDIVRTEKGKVRTELYAGIRAGAEFGMFILALILAAATLGQ